VTETAYAASSSRNGIVPPPLCLASWASARAICWFQTNPPFLPRLAKLRHEPRSARFSPQPVGFVNMLTNVNNSRPSVGRPYFHYFLRTARNVDSSAKILQVPMRRRRSKRERTGESAQCHLSIPLDPSFGPKSPAFASGRRRASARRQARGSILGRSETCPTSFAVRRVRATTGQFENLSGIGRKRLSHLVLNRCSCVVNTSGYAKSWGTKLPRTSVRR